MHQNVFYPKLFGTAQHLFYLIPLQILSMIEEAAGTRMYESKKMSAQKTIERKDTKLREIETVSDPISVKIQYSRPSLIRTALFQRVFISEFVPTSENM